MFGGSSSSPFSSVSFGQNASLGAAGNSSGPLGGSTVFGSTQPTMFGGGAGSGFGFGNTASTAAAAFGTSTVSAPPSSPGIFGVSPPNSNDGSLLLGGGSPSPFGSVPSFGLNSPGNAANPSGSVFGAASGGSVFGAPSGAASGLNFGTGANPAANVGFGTAPVPSSPSALAPTTIAPTTQLFPSTTGVATSGPQTGGLFGTTTGSAPTTTLFGAPAVSGGGGGGGLFGNTTTASSSTAALNTTATAQPALVGGVFGTQNASSGLFGASPASGPASGQGSGLAISGFGASSGGSSGFGFGTSTTTAAAGGGAAPAALSFGFGGANSAPSLTQPAAVPSGTTLFGATAATSAPASPTTGLFGTSSSGPAVSGLSFGGASPGQTSGPQPTLSFLAASSAPAGQTFGFGAASSAPAAVAAPAAAAASGTLFGATTAATGPASSPTSGLFGKPATTITTTTTTGGGGGASGAASGFGFGLSSSPAAATTAAAAASPGGISFGTATAGASSGAAGFGLGLASSGAGASTLGGTSTLFGASSTAAAASSSGAQSATGFNFGAASSGASLFGSSTAAAAPATTAPASSGAAASGGISFGLSTTPAVATSSAPAALTASTPAASGAALVNASSAPATPTGILGTGLPSDITGRTLGDISKKWFKEAKDAQEEFRKFADNISDWDIQIVQNAAILHNLAEEYYKLDSEQEAVVGQLEALETDQKEVDAALDRFRTEVDNLIASSNHRQDLEGSSRKAIYERAESISGDLMNIEDHLRSIMTRMDFDTNKMDTRSGNDSDPMAAIIKILNNQLIALQQLETDATGLEGTFKMAKFEQENAGGRQSGSNRNELGSNNMWQRSSRFG